MEESDADAVRAARQGQEPAFRLLVEKHSLKIFHLAYQMTANQEDAEDIVQETFIRAYRQLHRFEERADFGTWLHRIAANCALDLLRKRARTARHHEALQLEEAVSRGGIQEFSPRQAAALTEVDHEVRTALDRLTPLEKAAFVLRHFEGKSIAEIAVSLDLGLNAAKQSIFRAVRKLRRALEPPGI